MEKLKNPGKAAREKGRPNTPPNKAKDPVGSEAVKRSNASGGTGTSGGNGNQGSTPVKPGGTQNQAQGKPVDVALGLDTIDGKPALSDFARMTGAHRDNAWKGLGLHEAPLGRFDIAFEQSLNKVVAGGGKIKFNLDSLDVRKALCGDPAERVGRYTEWELQQIVRNRQWLDSAEFYLNGQKLTAGEVGQLGLKHVP